MTKKDRAVTLRPAQIRHLLRVTEIARLLVADVLMPSGSIRQEVSLRAAITKGCRQRCIYLAHKDTIEALEAYIEHRWSTDQGKELDRKRYRGLLRFVDRHSCILAVPLATGNCWSHWRSIR